MKTDAPNDVLWDIMRCWAKKMGVTVGKLKDQEDVAAALLKVEPKLVEICICGFRKFWIINFLRVEADFTENLKAESTSKKDGILRFQPKTQKFWGPKSKAKGR